MTNRDKSLLREMVKEGRSRSYILKYINCCDATIKKYRKAFEVKESE